MDILIVDTDIGARNVYAGLLTSIFPALHIRYADSAEQARKSLKLSPPDLVILDFYSVEQPFPFMRELTAQAHPFIVFARNDEERIIVESLKGGALDFVAKKNIKLGYLKQVIARALLEVPRWQHMQRSLNEGPQYTEHEKFNAYLQQYVLTDTGMDCGRNSLELVPGRSYQLIFQYCSVRLPAISYMDEEARQNHMHLILDRIGSIVSARGGLVWTRKSDATISIFAANEHQNAILSAIEGQAALIDICCRVYVDRPNALYAMDTGQVVYTEDRGDLVSEAINLTAHMAEKSPFERGILVTDNLFKKLDQRTKKYFFSIGKEFEGHRLHSFEHTA